VCVFISSLTAALSVCLSVCPALLCLRLQVFAVKRGVLGFQFKGEEPIEIPAGQTVVVTEGRWHRFRNAATTPGADVEVELAVSPAGLDGFFEAARLLGGCARAGEMSAEAALGALGEVRAEVGVENMTDEEVIPPLASVEGAQRPRL
jgi:hypothetical protein